MDTYIKDALASSFIGPSTLLPGAGFFIVGKKDDHWLPGS